MYKRQTLDRLCGASFDASPGAAAAAPLPSLVMAAVVVLLPKYASRRLRSRERSMKSKKWSSIFSTADAEDACTVGTIVLQNKKRSEKKIRGDGGRETFLPSGVTA